MPVCRTATPRRSQLARPGLGRVINDIADRVLERASKPVLSHTRKRRSTGRV